MRIIFNPVKHGLVERVEDWPWSSYHRYVRDGLVTECDWESAKDRFRDFERCE
jgi:putative transposase